MGKYRKRYNLNQKLDDMYSQYSIHCKNCGHTIYFLPFEKKEKKICSWCQHVVYANDNIEFKDRLKKLMG